LAGNFETGRIGWFVSKWQSITRYWNIVVSGYKTECERTKLKVLKIKNTSFAFEELQVIRKEVYT
jgi:hypothetical protein